ncbi:Basic form of pathogenesis-related protein 1 [Linum grandiflorum]
MMWDPNLAAYAEYYANSRTGDCNIVNSGGPYGENLAKGSSSSVVWQNSVRLGCARAQCSNGWWFVTCNYDPPGNYIGQRPY